MGTAIFFVSKLVSKLPITYKNKIIHWIIIIIKYSYAEVRIKLSGLSKYEDSVLLDIVNSDIETELWNIVNEE